MQMTAHRARGSAGSLKANFVVRISVADVQGTGRRVYRHVEQHSSDVREGSDLSRWIGGCVDRENVAIGKIEANGNRPVASEMILPQSTGVIVFHDQAGLGSADSFDVGVRFRQTTRRAPAGQPVRDPNAVDGTRAGKGAA